MVEGIGGKYFVGQVPKAFKDYRKYKNQYKACFYSMAGTLLFTAAGAIGFNSSHRTIAATGLTRSFFSFINVIVFMSSGEAKPGKGIQIDNQLFQGDCMRLLNV